MDRGRAVLLLGGLAAAGLFAGYLVPYLVGVPRATATYYGVAPVPMALVGLLALLSTGAVLAWLAGALSPSTVAGALAVLGAATVVLTAAWALAVPRHVVLQYSTTDAFVYHRGALVVLAALVAAGGLPGAARALQVRRVG